MHIVNHQIKSYFNYLRRRKSRYSIHSPFIFEFINDVLRSKKKPCNDARVQLLKNKNTIKKTDLGAGSQKLNNNTTVKRSTKTSALSPKYCRILYNIIKKYKPGNMLELGTHFGVATIVLNEGFSEGKITTVEGCRETAKIARETIQKFAAQKKNIELIETDFDSFISQVTNKKKYDFIYIDGNHRKEPTLKYFDFAVNNCSEFCIVVLDDIYWSEEMTEAWKKIVHQNKYYTVDLFRFGIVFIDQQLKPQHFILKT